MTVEIAEFKRKRTHRRRRSGDPERDRLTPSYTKGWTLGIPFEYNARALHHAGGQFDPTTETVDADGVNPNHHLDNLVRQAVANQARILGRDANGKGGGYLGESARTNLFLYSEAFDNAAWTKTELTVTADQIAAPDGKTTADKVVETTTNAGHQVKQNVTFVDGTAYTMSRFVKKLGRRYVKMTLHTQRFPGAPSVIFDLDAGAVDTETDVDDSGVEDYGDGWYRCWLSATADSDGACAAYFWALDDDKGATYAGDVTKGFYTWGAQLEAGAGPSSYIPTTDSTKTRDTDVQMYGNTGSLGLAHTEAAIMMVVTFRSLVLNSDIFNALNADAKERIMIYMGAKGSLAVQTRRNGEYSAVSAGGIFTAGTPVVVCATYSSSLLKLYADGVSIGTPAASPNVPNDLSIGLRLQHPMYGVPAGAEIQYLYAWDHAMDDDNVLTQSRELADWANLSL